MLNRVSARELKFVPLFYLLRNRLSPIDSELMVTVDSRTRQSETPQSVQLFSIRNWSS